MAFEKITDTDLVDKGISGLPDVPGLTTTAMQAKFDELSKDVIIPKLNAIVEGLNGTEVGNSSKVIDPTEQKEKNIQNTIDAIYAIVAANAEAKHTHSNKTDLDKITSTFLDAVSSLIQMLSGISSVATSVTDDDTIIPTAGAIVDYVVKLGAGDMTKAVYDKDNDGVVDDASKLGGEAPSSYLKVAELSDATVAFSDASTRENIQTGEDVKTVLGKVAKWFSDMTAAAFAQTITSYADLMANTVSGYFVDALAVKSGFETINSNLSTLKNHETVETVVGTWIDGKTIYKKSYCKSFDSPIKTEYVVDASINFENIDAIIKCEGSVNSSNDALLQLPYAYNGYIAVVRLKNSGLFLQINLLEVYNFVITVYYTKK